MYLAFATELEDLKSCDPPFSLYDFIDRLMPGKDVNRNPFHRLCTLMRKMHARSFLEETLILNEELRQEKEMLDQKFGGNIEYCATRLTFFCVPTDRLNWQGIIVAFEKYLLAYAVVVNFKLPDGQRISHILEAVVRPPSVVIPLENNDFFIQPITNYYIHNTRQLMTTIGPVGHSKTLNITGSFFTQQNNQTSVCAHAALRMAMNSSFLTSESKLTNQAINSLLSLPPERWHTGLGMDDIIQVVDNLGYDVHTMNFLSNTEVEYDHFLYPALESSCPTILGIQGWNARESRMTSHVVTVLGHTTNSDRWDPEARSGYGNYPLVPYISSACWCDHYIMSDDNFGMFSTLPADMLRNFIVPTKNPNLHASMAITITPRGVKMPGYVAEQAATIHAMGLISLINSNSISGINIWLKRLYKYNIVCRTILQTSQQYRQFIEKQDTSLTAEQRETIDNLPEYLWVSEITLPNLYTGNKHKLGDVVINAGAAPEDHKEGRSLVLNWFPDIILLGPDLVAQPWGITSHVPLIRSTENIPLLEW